MAMRTGDCEVVLLGSLATGKYLDILRPIFGQRLRIPEEFIGLGDMSRGGLLLRCVRDAKELRYMEAGALPALPVKQRRATKERTNDQLDTPQAPTNFHL